MNSTPHPTVRFTQADRAATAKLTPMFDDGYLQVLLLREYPAGLPPGVESWGELLFKILIA